MPGPIDLTTSSAVLPPAPVPELPPEVWQTIGERLGDVDYLAMSRVNRAAHTAALNPRRLAGRLALISPSSVVSEPPTAQLARLQALHTRRSQVLDDALVEVPFLARGRACLGLRQRARGGQTHAFLAGGRRLLTSDTTPHMTLWDVRRHGATRVLQFFFDAPQRFLAASADARMFAFTDDDDLDELGAPIEIWDTQGNRPTLVRTVAGHLGALNLGAFSADAKYFVSVSEREASDGMCQVTPLHDLLASPRMFVDRADYTHTARMAASGTHMSFAFGNGTAHLIDLRQPRPRVRTFSCPSGGHHTVFLAPHAVQALILYAQPGEPVEASLVDLDRDVDADARVQRVPSIAENHCKPIFSPNGRYLVTNVFAGSLQAVALARPDARPITLLENTERAQLYITFSPSGGHLLSQSVSAPRANSAPTWHIWRLDGEAPEGFALCARAGDDAHYSFWREGSILLRTSSLGTYMLDLLDEDFWQARGEALRWLRRRPECQLVDFSPSGELALAQTCGAQPGGTTTLRLFGPPARPAPNCPQDAACPSP